MGHFCGAMSAAPDPAELAPSRDPAAYGKRRLFTATFLAWIVLCLICLGGGALIGRFALPPPAQPQGPGPIAEPAPRGAPSAPVSPPAASATTAPPSSTAPAAADSALSDRVARLETASSQASGAAAGSAGRGLAVERRARARPVRPGRRRLRAAGSG